MSTLTTTVIDRELILEVQMEKLRFGGNQPNLLRHLIQLRKESDNLFCFIVAGGG